MESNYLSEINKIISNAQGTDDGLLVVNKEGIIEYFKEPADFNFEAHSFYDRVIGKHLLDVYDEITEENSTVMKTLKTGEVTIAEVQTFTFYNTKIQMMTITYPIVDDKGEIQGAVDVIQHLKQIYPQVEKEIDNVDEALDRIKTANKDIERIKHNLESIAKYDSPVVIFGETGTGKELFAETLHSLSSRRDKPFLSQNCAAIPKNLLESIFFGTERGGFTGAESKPGLFEQADGGTLFLDELNSLGVAMQAKLLKAIEEGKVRRIGGEKEIEFNVRLISALNERPEKLEAEGRMRADFYYRISVVKIELPPLRDRKEDIKLLTDFYIEFYNKQMDRNVKGLTTLVKDLFYNWHWPGNVRELKNTIESAFNMEKGDYITLESVQELLEKNAETDVEPVKIELPQKVESADMINHSLIKKMVSSGSLDLDELIENVERSVLEEVLVQNRKLVDAARVVGISPQKLQYRMNKLKLK